MHWIFLPKLRSITGSAQNVTIQLVTVQHPGRCFSEWPSAAKWLATDRLRLLSCPRESSALAAVSPRPIAAISKRRLSADVLGRWRSGRVNDFVRWTPCRCPSTYDTFSISTSSIMVTDWRFVECGTTGSGLVGGAFSWPFRWVLSLGNELAEWNCWLLLLCSMSRAMSVKGSVVPGSAEWLCCSGLSFSLTFLAILMVIQSCILSCLCC